MSPVPVPPVRLDVAPDPRHVRVVRLVTVALARMAGLGEEGIDDVRLAISEAVGRAVAAHRANDVDSPIEVEVSIGTTLQNTSLQVTVHDQVALPPATGPQAAQLLQAAAEEALARRASVDVGLLASPPDGLELDVPSLAEADLPALAEGVSLIESLADESSVITGPGGTVLAMGWRGAG